MSFAEIEAKRAQHGIPIGKLCRRADMDASTYHRRRKAPDGGYAETAAKLGQALEELIRERAGSAGTVAKEQQDV